MLCSLILGLSLRDFQKKWQPRCGTGSSLVFLLIRGVWEFWVHYPENPPLPQLEEISTEGQQDELRVELELAKKTLEQVTASKDASVIAAWSANERARKVDQRAREIEQRVQDAEQSVRLAENRARNAEDMVRYTENRARDAEERVRHAENSAQEAEERALVSEQKVLEAESKAIAAAEKAASLENDLQAERIGRA